MEQNTQLTDWFAARMLNEDKGLDFFIAEGITPATSKLESPDFYKNKRKVQEKFVKEDGSFDEQAFNNFYQSMAVEYSYLNAINTENYIYDTYEKSEVDFTTDFGKVIKPEFNPEFVTNPDKLSKGIVNFNEWSEPEWSKRELAQMNKYWDNETQSWSEQTVNEAGATGLLTGKSLMYATYDEDGWYEDPVTGEQVFKHKGDWKTDNWGNYYIETTENNENLGKQFVTISEVLTDDKSAWNSIDIFDSDSLETSIPKTVFKSAATVGSLLIPYVGAGIAYTTAAIDLARVMPQIVKTFSSLFNEDMEFDKLNKWDNYMRKFGHSQSDYAKSHFFSFESLMDMAVSSFKQLTQQRHIGKIPEYLGAFKKQKNAANISAALIMSTADDATKAAIKNTPGLLDELVKSSSIYRRVEESAQNYTKLSQAFSRGFLIATSTEDTYNLARQYGFDTQTSSMISLATMVGIGTLFSTDYFRGMLYNNQDYELRRDIKILVNQYLKNNKTKLVGEAVETVTDKGKENFFKTVGKSVTEFFNKHVSDMQSGRFSWSSGMINEALEETSEELMADFGIQLGKGWNSLKSAITGKEYADDYSYIESDPLKRYATAFFGGALGGGIFTMANRLHFEKKAFTNWHDMLKDNTQIMDQLSEYVSQGKADMIITEIDKLSKTPMISGNISALTGQPTNIEAETQNNVLFSSFKKAIKDMDTFATSHDLKIDKETFGDVEIARNLRIKWLRSEGLTDALFGEYQVHFKKAMEIGAALQDANVSLEMAQSEEDKAMYRSRISDLNKKLEYEKELVRKLLNGEDDTYLGCLMMQSNPRLTGFMFASTKEEFAKKLYNLDYSQLDSTQQKVVDDKVQNLENSGEKEVKYYKAWELFKQIASSQKLKSILTSNTFTSNLSRLGGTNIERDGQLYLAPLSDNPDVLTQFRILSNILVSNGTKRKHANTIASNIFKIDNIPDYIEVEYVNSRQQPESNRSVEGIISQINAYFDEYETWYKENKDKSVQVPAKFVEIHGQDLKHIKTLKELLVSQVSNYTAGFGLMVAPMGIINLDYLYSAVDSILLELGYISEDSDFSSKAILDELSIKYAENPKEFQISDEQEVQLTQIAEAIQLLSEISSVSYDGYSNFLNNVIPFGASNFLNKAFKDKKLNIELLQLDQNTLGVIKEWLTVVNQRTSSLLDISRINSKTVTREDQKLAIRYDLQKVTYITDLVGKLNGFDVTPFVNFNFTDKNIDDFTEEDFVKYGIELRNLIIKFEEMFYEYFSNTENKPELVKYLAEYCSDKLDLHGDTSSIITDENAILFNKTDLYHFLMMTSFDHLADVQNAYRMLFDSEIARCPFDSQEQIMLQVMKWLYHNDDVKLWMNELNKSLDIANQKNNTNELFLLERGIKMMCGGGTGKTSTILPGIFYMINKVFPEKNCIFVANTNKQLKSLMDVIKLVPRNSDEVPENMTISTLLAFSDDDFKNYQNSIIFIDECTNITSDNLKRLDNLCKKYNIDIIYSGDTTQVGAVQNIDQAVMASTSGLYDSKRSSSDIGRLNLLFWKRLMKGNHSTVDFNVNGLSDFTFYKQEGLPFTGIYFTNPEDVTENVLSKETIDAFIKKHPLNKPNKSILIFTTESHATELGDQFGEIYEGYEITIATNYEDIQGSEWDYVFTDVDINLVGKSDGDSYNSEMYEKVRKIYTLFTRFRDGIVIMNNKDKDGNILQNMMEVRDSDGEETVYGFNERVNPSIYPPVYSSISVETILAYKEFKKQVLDNLEYSKSSGDQPKPKPGDIPEPKMSEVLSPLDLAECAPGFVHKDDLNVQLPNGLTLGRLRMTLYEVLTKCNTKLLENLPKEWRSGEFLIKYMETRKEDLYNFGNWGRDDKHVKKVHPWLVYSVIIDGERKDIHLGMFHNQLDAEDKGMIVTHATKNVNIDRLNASDKSVYFRIPKLFAEDSPFKFSRSGNPVDVQNEVSGNNYTHVVYDSGKLKFVTNVNGNRPFDFLNASAAFYFRRGDDSIVPIDSILDAIDTQGKHIQKIVAKAKELGFLDEEMIHYLLPYIRQVKNDKDESEWIARGVVDLENQFVSFVKLNSEDNNLSLIETLQNWAHEYLQYINTLNSHLQEIENVISEKGKIAGEIIPRVKELLSIRPISNISLVVYDHEVIDSKEEYEKTLQNLSNDSDAQGKQQLKSYHTALTYELWVTLNRIYDEGVFSLDDKTKTRIRKNFPKDVADRLIKSWDLESHIKEQEPKLLEKINKQFGSSYNSISEFLRDHNFKDNIGQLKSLFSSKEFIDFFTPIFGFSDNSDTNAAWGFWIKEMSQKTKSKSRKKSKIRTHKRLFPKLLKNNGIALDGDSLSVIRQDVEGNSVSFKVNKVVQPARILMYVNESFDWSTLEKVEEVVPQDIEPVEDPNPFIDPEPVVQEITEQQVVNELNNLCKQAKVKNTVTKDIQKMFKSWNVEPKVLNEVLQDLQTGGKNLSNFKFITKPQIRILQNAFKSLC